MNNVDTTQTITHLSLCSGYSGIGLGLKRVLPSLREIAHVEIEAYAIANLVKKMEESSLPPAPIFTDLKAFPFASFRGCVDILSGGFPCQPFSSAGKRLGTEDPRHLFPYIAKGIGLCRPRLVFLENVEGIISAKMPDGTSVLQYVLRELESLGYRATAGVFSASEVGAAHQRKRVFILAVANTLNERSQGTHEAGRENQQGWSGEEVRGATAGHGAKDAKGRKYCGGAKDAKPRLREAVANTEHPRPHGATISRSSTEAIRDYTQGENSTEQPERVGISSELADTKCERLQGAEPIGREKPIDEQSTHPSGETMADAELHGRREGCEEIQTEPPGWNHSGCLLPIARPGERQYGHEEPRVKPKVGRAANGTEDRVDSLRMSGNGVVPYTAELAFRILRERLI